MRRRAAILAILTAASAAALAEPERVVTCGPYDPTRSADSYLEEARQFARAGDPEMSVCLAQTALSRLPTNSIAWTMTHVALGLYHEAADHPRDALHAYIAANSSLSSTFGLTTQWTPFGDAHPLRLDNIPATFDALARQLSERSLALLPQIDDMALRSSVVSPLLFRAGQAGDSAEIERLARLMPCAVPTRPEDAGAALMGCATITNALDATFRQMPAAEDFATFEQRFRAGGAAALTPKAGPELRAQLEGMLPVLDAIEPQLSPDQRLTLSSARAVIWRGLEDPQKARQSYLQAAADLRAIRGSFGDTDAGNCGFAMSMTATLTLARDPGAPAELARGRELCARAFPGDSFSGAMMQASLDLVEVVEALEREDWPLMERKLSAALVVYRRIEVRPGSMSQALERSLALALLAQGRREEARAALERANLARGNTWINGVNRLGFAVDREQMLADAQRMLDGYAMIPSRQVQPLSLIALMQAATGDPAAQRTLDRIAELQRGAAAWERADLAEHRATLRARAGDRAGAFAALSEALALREEDLPRISANADATQLDVVLVALARAAEFGVAACLGGPCEGAAAEVALTGLLRQKGRALDLQATSLARLQASLDPESLALYRSLASVREQLARESLAGADTTGLRAEQSRLEQALATRSPAVEQAGRTVDLAAVRARLGPEDALIEYTVYRPYDVHFPPGGLPWGEARYAAVVLRASGAPAWVDLGPAEAIDGLVANARQALADELGLLDIDSAREAAKALDGALLRPIEAQLGGAKRWFVAPDGALNLVPFGALIDAQGRYRIDGARIVALTSGRELLSAGAGTPTGDKAVLIGAPDYGDSPADDAISRAIGAWGSGFAPLPGTLDEVRALRKRLGRGLVLTGSAATESALKQLASPPVLHIATHGFFLDATSPDSPAALMPADPLLRSGLAFAGANVGGQGGDDGLLTALEAANLQLRGTELVVLSACETGVGTIRAGDGVQGMRRALTLAGARSQVLSLWAVDDEATLVLMQAFYAELTRGTDRAEALRKAQLALAQSKQFAHPMYWAAWVLSGEDGPMGW